MSHDATKVVMGSVGSNKRVVTTEPADPADFPAGTAVRRASDGGLQTEDDSTAALIGISMGKDLSNTAKTAVCRKALGVPLKLKKYYASGTVQITAYASLVSDTDDTLEVADVVFTAQSGAATPGDATFQAATSDEATATSLAAQINAHEDLDGVVTAEADGDEVVITAVEHGEGGNALTFEYTDNDTNVGLTVTGSGTLAGGIDQDDVAVHGQVVYVNDEGLGCDSEDADAAATGATYNGGVFTGIFEDGSEDTVAVVDIAGAL